MKLTKVGDRFVNSDLICKVDLAVDEVIVVFATLEAAYEIHLEPSSESKLEMFPYFVTIDRSQAKGFIRWLELDSRFHKIVTSEGIDQYLSINWITDVTVDQEFVEIRLAAPNTLYNVVPDDSGLSIEPDFIQVERAQANELLGWLEQNAVSIS